VLKKMPRTAGLSAAVVCTGLLAAAAGTVPAQAAATGSTYTFRTFANKCVNVYNDGMEAGLPVIQLGCNGSALSQQFTVTQTGTAADTYQIQTQTGMCLQVSNESTANGAPIDISNCQGLASQVFTIPTAAPESWLTIQTFAGKCLQVQNANDGVRIFQGTCGDTMPTQKFLPVPVQ
jgi:hypothetical protein